MNDASKKIFDKKSFAIALISCLIIGFIPALIVSRETSGYVAGMSFGIITLIFGLPLVGILFVASIVATVSQNWKYAIIFSSSFLLIPLVFGGSMKLLEATGIAVYTRKGVDDMRSFETDSAKGWTIVFKKGLKFKEIENFTNDSFFPRRADVGFTHESGVCELSGNNIQGKEYTIDTIYFCNTITKEQKDKLREKLKESALVYKFYENIKLEDIKDLP
jgi:hypothetical protein